MSTECQRRFWNTIVQLRVDIYYLDLIQQASEHWENCINIFLAVVSNGSIAAWALWSKFPWVWPVLIGISQSINAIRPYLPYQRRTRSLRTLSSEIEDIALFAEHQWYAVSEGRLTDEEINDALIDIQRRRSKAEKTHLDSVSLPIKKKPFRKAEERAMTYFRANYPTGELNGGQ